MACTLYTQFIVDPSTSPYHGWKKGTLVFDGQQLSRYNLEGFIYTRDPSRASNVPKFNGSFISLRFSLQSMRRETIYLRVDHLAKKLLIPKETVHTHHSQGDLEVMIQELLQSNLCVQSRSFLTELVNSYCKEIVKQTKKANIRLEGIKKLISSIHREALPVITDQEKLLLRLTRELGELNHEPATYIEIAKLYRERIWKTYPAFKQQRFEAGLILGTFHLSVKAWSDKAVWNIDFQELQPIGSIGLPLINALEKAILELLDYRVTDVLLN